MLVLRRAPGEQLLIAGDIRVTVLAIEGQRVKLGIEAPKDLLIVRAELLEGEQRPDKEPKDG